MTFIYRAIPFRTTRRFKVTDFTELREAQDFAQKVANSTGDWCAVEERNDCDQCTAVTYVHPARAKLRRQR